MISQTFSECWLVGTLQCPMGPLQLRFHPLAQTSSYATGHWWSGTLYNCLWNLWEKFSFLVARCERSM